VDFWKAVEKISKECDLEPDDARWVLDGVIEHLVADPERTCRKRQRRHAIEPAVEIVLEQYEHAAGAVCDIFSPIEVGRLIRSRRAAVAWLILIAKYRATKPAQYLDAAHDILMDARAEMRGTTRKDTQCRNSALLLAAKTVALKKRLEP
jgi:hypothetical protein